MPSSDFLTTHTFGYLVDRGNITQCKIYSQCIVSVKHGYIDIISALLTLENLKFKLARAEP